MVGPRKAMLDKVETEYLRAQIDQHDNARIKAALQSLCKSYRRGLTVRPDLLTGVVNSLIGTAFSGTIDEKVRRWVLNALARVARDGAAIPAIQHILKRHGDEPQTVAAGIAAVYKLCRRADPEEVLKGLSYDPQMRTLAALQHVPAKDLDLGDLPVNVDDLSRPGKC